jgi:hypothetical protein
MGSNDHYPEEGPVRRVRVDGFWADSHPVTNDEFAAFIDSTGYLTVAEQPLDPCLYSGTPPENLAPGSLLFVMTGGPVDLGDFSQWWRWTTGVSWRHPSGPSSDLEGLGNHPVVHGLARCCQQKQSGSMRPEGGWRAPNSFGEIMIRKNRHRWPTRGRVHFRTRTQSWMAGLLPPLWMHFRQMDTGCWTWLGTYGSGRTTGTGPDERVTTKCRAVYPTAVQISKQQASTPRCPEHRSPARYSKADRIFARSNTAIGTGQRRGSLK